MYKQSTMSWNKIPIKPVKQRFLEKVSVNKSNGCWEWTGAWKRPEGYGFFWMNRSKKNEYAHRVSFEIFNRKHPGDLQVCHTCDNPKCVNPDHLFLGTAKDNMRDRSNKGRTLDCERSPRAKITDAIARAIFLSDETHATIARKHGVSVGTVYFIRARRTWVRATDGLSRLV